MSVYFTDRGWRYNFYHQKTRYQSNLFYHTKREAKNAEARRREEIENEKTIQETTPTDMAFLKLLERRLDHVRAYNSKRHLDDYIYMSRRWAMHWGDCLCSQVTQADVQEFILKRSSVSAYTANKDLRYLRATFNYGMRQSWIQHNPTAGIAFLPVTKTVKRIPSKADVFKVILAADPDTQDYLYTILDTMARVSEVNRLTWDDINFEERSIILWTRKKRGGHLTPRKVPMTGRLYGIMAKRYRDRDQGKSWIFWQTWWDRNGQYHEGPYIRRRFMERLCRDVGVPVFQFHALRHFGASVLDHTGVGIGSIQRLLGHENRSTTEIYLQSIGEAERRAMEVFEETLDEEKMTHKVTHINRIK